MAAVLHWALPLPPLPSDGLVGTALVVTGLFLCNGFGTLLLCHARVLFFILLLVALALARTSPGGYSAPSLPW